MKDITLDGVEISHEGKSAKGVIDYDRNEYAPESPELLKLVKEELSQRYGFKAETVKIQNSDGCSDTFAASAE